MKLGFYLSALLFFAVTLQAQVAHADDCGPVAERGQVERNQGRLFYAKDSFATCSRAECAPEIREYCARWLAEVDHALGSVVVTLSQDGRDITDAKLTIDGRLVKSTLGVEAVTLEPGKHHIKVESREGSLESDVVLHEGEKAKAVPLSFPSTKKPTAPAAPTSSFTPAVIGFGTVGIVAAGAAVGFLVAALVDKSNLTLRCGSDPTKCSASDRATGRAFEYVTEISGGVAVVSLGVATWLLVRAPAAPPNVKGVAGPRGVVMGLEARF